MVPFSKSTGKGKLEGSPRTGLAILGLTVIAARVQLYRPRISGTITLAPSVPSPALSGGPDDSDAQPAMDNDF